VGNAHGDRIVGSDQDPRIHPASGWCALPATGCRKQAADGEPAGVSTDLK
jgi:hypothetical protein